MYLHSIAAYGDEIFDGMDPESLAELRLVPEADLPMYHLTWGMSIRNECGLWHTDHPLTANWHNHPESRDLRRSDEYGLAVHPAGIDCSPDHPDAVSSAIMLYVHRKACA